MTEFASFPLGLAFLAGLVSFLSPCVFPIVPSYVGFVTGLTLDELRDGSRFATCYHEDRGGARTALNNRAADALRVRATPSFFINGRLVEGALPAEQFRQVLSKLAGAQ